MPVLLSLYGGAFRGGDTGPIDSTTYLMDEDVVVVTSNYRINIFGFGTLGDSVLPGNFGVKDGVMALRWIKQNIEAFGGDPKSVTVFGFSAGAQMAQHLLKSPLCDREDLVTRAVSDSGSINHVSSLMNTDEVAANTRKVAALAGCTNATSEELLACLQEANILDLVNGVNAINPPDQSKLPFAPVIEPADAEDAVIPEDISIRPTNKPWLTRFSNGEYCLYEMGLDKVPSGWFENISANLTTYLKSWIGQHTTDEVQKTTGAELLKDYYFKVTTPLSDFCEEFAKMHGDDGFVYPALFNIMNHQGPKWIARFEYYSTVNSSSVVASHASEGLYVMKQNHAFNMDASDLAMSKLLIRYLVNFAYYSNPTPPGSDFTWPQFTPEGFEVLRTTRDGEILADETIVAQLRTILNMWSYVIGWK